MPASPAAEKGPPPTSPPGDRTRRRRAIHCPAAIVLFVCVIAAGLTGDLLSKHYVFKSMLADPSLPERIGQIRALSDKELTTRDILNLLRVQREISAGVKFTLSTNPGVVFGLPMSRPVIAGATVLTILLVLYFFAVADGRAYWMQSAMALILGGALGNFYDRLLGEVFLPGPGLEPIRYHVRDFIDCSAVPPIYYPWIFNVADILLVIGVAALLIHSLVSPRARTVLQKRKRRR